jgi:hypothetical protein
MGVAFLNERFGSCEGQDFEGATARGPGRGERRPAGPFGLMFVAQRGDGRGAAVPDPSPRQRPENGSDSNDPPFRLSGQQFDRLALSSSVSVSIAASQNSARANGTCRS